MREARFARAIDDLVRRVQPDLVVVETSGVAEPGPTAERLREAGLSIDAVIALVDAEHARATLRTQAIARAQVAGADFLVLNRTDLVAPNDIAPLERHLRELNARALVLPAVRAEVDLELLFATGAGPLRARSAQQKPVAVTAPAERPASHGLSARVFRSEAALSLGRLERALAALPIAVHRTKGIARVAESGLALLFNGVRRRVELEWLPFAAADTQAVVIGEDLDTLWPEIERALVACIEPERADGPGSEPRPTAPGASDASERSHD